MDTDRTFQPAPAAGPGTPDAARPPEHRAVSGSLAALLAAAALLVGLASGLAVGTAGGYFVATRLATGQRLAPPSPLGSAAALLRGSAETAETPPARPEDLSTDTAPPGLNVIPLDPSDPDFGQLLEQLPPELRELLGDLVQPPPAEPDA